MNIKIYQCIIKKFQLAMNKRRFKQHKIIKNNQFTMKILSSMINLQIMMYLKKPKITEYNQQIMKIKHKKQIIIKIMIIIKILIKIKNQFIMINNLHKFMINSIKMNKSHINQINIQKFLNNK